MSTPPTARTDLTRWNRTGLSRFAYVDGNAATFLEDLRIAMLVRYLRGATGDARSFDYWRDLFTATRDHWPDEATLADLRSKLAWSGLLPAFPSDQERAPATNKRLVDAYNARTGDYTADIMRAFARAAHVLMGYAGAYANEGYLRTATQWESLRRLASMVGYQPTPAASATTVVALIVHDGLGATDLDRGLAMRAPSPAGGPQLVFETIRLLTVHPALNAVRADGADRNLTELDLTGSGARFVAPKDAVVSPGDLVVLVRPDGQGAKAATVGNAVADPVAGIVTVTIDSTKAVLGTWISWSTQMMTAPMAILNGSPRPQAGFLVLETPSSGLFHPGDVIQMSQGGSPISVVVAGVANGSLSVQSAATLWGTVNLLPMVAHDRAGRAYIETPTSTTVYYNNQGTVVQIAVDTTPIAPDSTAVSGARSALPDKSGPAIAYRYPLPYSAGQRGFTIGDATASVPAKVVTIPPAVTGTLADPNKTMTFPGKPPKGLTIGDVFALRGDGVLQAATVEGVRMEPDRFHVQFDTLPDASKLPTMEFHGPMRRTLLPESHDRSFDPALSGATVVLQPPPDAAAALIDPGRVFIVEDSRGIVAPVLATVSTVTHTNPNLTVLFAEDPGRFAGFKKGWTLFRGNAVPASHGESLGARVLGSGLGDIAEQTFNLPVKDIAFIPSSASETGVVPDILVAVGGRFWDARDLTDVDADGTEAYSPTVRDDGTLNLHFRRRLPKGTDNVVVTSHRVGSGPRGNLLPAYSFTKPAAKNPVIDAIAQPFETSGGSERERVADIRVNAPGRLAANDRAVSVDDFARLARLHASVWQAVAEVAVAPGPGQRVVLTIVPADGATLTSTLTQAITDFVLVKAAPGTTIELHDFIPVEIAIEATVNVDTTHHARDKIEDAVRAALVAAFALRRRGIGQPLFIGEVLAAMESVVGASGALAKITAPHTQPARISHAGDGSISAMFPNTNQVAYIAAATAIVLTSKAVS